MESISISRVQSYLACPLKYKFEHVDQIPKPFRAAALAFGGSVHAAIEWFHKERIEGREPSVETAISQFDADWYAQNLEPLAFGDWDSKESLAEKGRELVRLYLGQMSTTPEAVEAPFEVELYDPVTGEVTASRSSASTSSSRPRLLGSRERKRHGPSRIWPGPRI